MSSETALCPQGRSRKAEQGRERRETRRLKAEGGGGDGPTPEAALCAVLGTSGGSEHPADTKGFLNSTRMTNDTRKG